MDSSVRLKAMEKELKDCSKDVIAFIKAISDDMSFVETDRFISSSATPVNYDGEGVISGFTSISGINVSLFVINPSVQKGGIGFKNSEKIVKCINNAVKCRQAIVGVFDTSGARIGEGINAMEGYGKILKAYTDAYGLVPIISVIKGNNFGLSSFVSAMSDICIGYDKSLLATSSPLIISAKANKDINLAATAAVHSKQTGLYSIVVKSDKELKDNLSKLLNLFTDTLITPADDGNRTSKLLASGISAQMLIDEVFDKNSFIEIKKEFAQEIRTGFARLNGIAVGVAVSNSEVNEGRLSTLAAEKLESFIYTLSTVQLPLINLVNSKGIINSLKEENSSLIRKTADLMLAYNSFENVKISLVFGDAIGIAYTTLCNKSATDYTLAWHSANIGILEDAAAAQLLYSEQIASSKDKDNALKSLAEAYNKDNTNALTVAANGIIDNVIDPQFSRQYLIAALQSFISK